MLDDLVVRMAIWDQIPERRHALLEYERRKIENALEDESEPYFGAYSYISDVLVDFFLDPVLDSEECDDGILKHCGLALEQMLSTGSSYIEDALAIRLVRDLFEEPHRWRRFRPFTGPLFRKLMVKESEFYTWIWKEPVLEESDSGE